MTVRILSGLQHLLGGVRAYFADAGVTARVAVGLRASGRQDNQGIGGANRVVFIPFEPRSGAAGRITPPMHVGPRDIVSEADPEARSATVRAIGDWERRMVVEVWARDSRAAEDDEAQLYALEELLEQTKRAVDAIGLADVEWGDVTFIVPPERSYGIAVQVGLRFTHPLFDEPSEVGFPGFRIEKATA